MGDPLFVVKIDAEARAVIVGPREALLTAACTLKEGNWIGDGEAFPAGRPVLARVRSTREPAPGRLALIDGAPAVAFDMPEEGVAPGQACVLYAPEAPTRVLGGGFIQRGAGAIIPSADGYIPPMPSLRPSFASYARTPMGGFQGVFAPVKATELGAAAVPAAAARAGVSPEAVDQILMGCVLPAGLGQAPARQAALGAGLPTSVEATTVNKMCGSGMQAAIPPDAWPLAGGRGRGRHKACQCALPLKSTARAPVTTTLLTTHMPRRLEDAYEPGRLMTIRRRPPSLPVHSRPRTVRHRIFQKAKAAVNRRLRREIFGW